MRPYISTNSSQRLCFHLRCRMMVLQSTSYMQGTSTTINMWARRREILNTDVDIKVSLYDGFPYYRRVPHAFVSAPCVRHVCVRHRNPHLQKPAPLSPAPLLRPKCPSPAGGRFPCPRGTTHSRPCPTPSTYSHPTLRSIPLNRMTASRLEEPTIAIPPRTGWPIPRICCGIFTGSHRNIRQ